MSKQNNLFQVFQLFLIIVPVFLWKYISNIELKFSFLLFVLFFTGYAFFRGFENILRTDYWESREKKIYRWLGVLMQIIMLFMFYTYANNILGIIKSI